MLFINETVQANNILFLKYLPTHTSITPHVYKHNGSPEIFFLYLRRVHFDTPCMNDLASLIIHDLKCQ